GLPRRRAKRVLSGGRVGSVPSTANGGTELGHGAGQNQLQRSNSRVRKGAPVGAGALPPHRDAGGRDRAGCGDIQLSNQSLRRRGAVAPRGSPAELHGEEGGGRTGPCYLRHRHQGLRGWRAVGESPRAAGGS
ncbi:unnamed protein product, partial [Laminaria digitata]